MPLLKLETSCVLSDAQRDALLRSLSKIVAQTIGKAEQYVMVTISPAAIVMSGKPDAAAFVDVRSIGGLSPETNTALSQEICRELQQALGVRPDRVYLNFTNVQAISWGWNGETFG